MYKRPFYVFYPSPLREQSMDTSTLFANLGRATKRGIKKCFKCGTYNGTRSIICKNTRCNAVFRECVQKHKASLEAIKLISGTSKQVYSVRVRDKGPDCRRGFVRLPLMQGKNNTDEKDVALAEVALCFVNSCQRLFNDSILKCHEMNEDKVTPICIHIKDALKSVNVAVPIETKSCILSLLSFNEDIKQELWKLSMDSEGALVQRVSKTVMAVKCQVTPKHPLGYLHFTFCVIKGKEVYDRFYCSCLNTKGLNYVNDNLEAFNQKCIHFYACIWAFVSDIRVTEEFVDFLNLAIPTNERTKQFAETVLGETEETRTKAIEEIRQWIVQNSKLHARTDDNSILAFLRGSKFNLDNAKQKIKNFYTMKAQRIEWFANRDPTLPTIEELVKLGVFVPLKKYNDNKLVVIIRTAAHDPKKHQQDDVFKAGNMILDVAIRENFENTSIYGISAIFDMKSVSLSHARQLPPHVIKNAVFSWQNYYCRPKQLEFVNAPLYINVVLNIFKGYMSEKLKGRVKVHFYGVDSLHAVFSKDILPIEYGGKDCSIHDLIEYWSQKLYEYRDWFKEDEKYKADLSD